MLLFIKDKNMTYDRMKAKLIHGKRCHFCGSKTLPLVKTRCCEQWVCYDTDYLPFRGGGTCQYSMLLN